MNRGILVMKNNIIYYSVGALMYCPANNKSIIKNLIDEKFGTKYSLAFCLEDTINDDAVEEAERDLISTLRTIYTSHKDMTFYLPKIFIRVRNAEQIDKILSNIGDARDIVVGFNLPKFNAEYGSKYISEILSANRKYNKKFYIMPILESEMLTDLQYRVKYLYDIKKLLDEVEELVLNVRVGGNDLSHAFGLRRHSFETIYDVKAVADVLIDILTVFSKDYIVSGAVWEYYNGENWDEGLKKELQKDMISGFVGKTAIHPKQIDVINNACKVFKEDLEDAKLILGWDLNSHSYVKGSTNNSRMNEYKTHYRWAERIKYLAEYYGVK